MSGRKKGPKVYELATECGVKPRRVLEAAALLGIPLQNRLTRMDPQVAQRLRAMLESPDDRAPSERP